LKPAQADLRAVAMWLGHTRESIKGNEMYAGGVMNFAQSEQGNRAVPVISCSVVRNILYVLWNVIASLPLLTLFALCET
jgi:hypothetical protein